MSKLKYRPLFENFIEDIKLKEYDQTYKQRLYQATVVLTFNKHIGGQDGEKVRELRAIENVTTITNKGVISEDPDHKKSVFSIKFILMPGTQYEHYLNKVFRSGITAVRGVHLNQIRKVEDITPEDPR